MDEAGDRGPESAAAVATPGDAGEIAVGSDLATGFRRTCSGPERLAERRAVRTPPPAAIDGGSRRRRGRAMVAGMNARDAGGADGGRRRVEAVFTSVARSYDLMNDLMSLGAHRLWRREAVAALRLRPGARGARPRGRGGRPRLSAARAGGSRGGVRRQPGDAPRRPAAGRRKRLARPVWSCADAEALPFADAAFDAAIVGFGIRNMPRIDDALAEAARVLKPCGRFVCLEFSPAVAPALAPVYGAWLRHAIPTLGAAVAGDRGAYEYLAESIRRFPPPEVLSAALVRAGFAGARSRSLWGGIVRLHCGWRV